MTTKEHWKPIPQAPKYEVSNLGRIRNPKKQIMKPWMQGNGLSVILRDRGAGIGVRVSRAVGQAFCRDYAHDRCATYRDGDCTNCKAANLKWVHRSEVTGIPYSREVKL